MQMFTNPLGFVHSSDMIGRYTHTRKQANLFFPLFSFFFLFYTNENSLPHTRRAVFVLLYKDSRSAGALRLPFGKGSQMKGIR